jgi:hypothetical protein
MQAPYPIRTGFLPICSAPDWARDTKHWPLRADFDNERDVIDAPDCVPAGSVHIVETKGCEPYLSQYAARF